MNKKKVVIIGGGASGFFCAIHAAKANPALDIMIVEKQNKVLQKIKVSGGGRCNVTHACFQQSELVAKYPRGKNFLKKTIQLFSPKDTIAFFETYGVQLKTEPDGRMFPTANTSQAIIDFLLKQIDEHKISLLLQSEVVEIKKKSTDFEVGLKNQDSLNADFVMVACGGFPKIEQYYWLQKLGHTIETPVPSLFTFNIPNTALKTLMGVVVENATVKIIGSKLQEQGPVLITHWGLSGPAILRLSAWGAKELATKNYNFKIVINWLSKPENELREKWNGIRNKQGAYCVSTKNPFGLPARLWDFLLQEASIAMDKKWSELETKEQNKLIHGLTTHELQVQGKTTFKEEFVTCGGVSLSEIEATTMESKLIKNLFFGGEIVDVDGITGGFNFQHAWASGYIAGTNIGKR